MLAGQPGEARWAGFPGLNWHAAKNYIKGVGESGIIPTAAAIVNAVEDALAPWGVEVDEVPLTGARVLALLRATGKRGRGR